MTRTKGSVPEGVKNLPSITSRENSGTNLLIVLPSPSLGDPIDIAEVDAIYRPLTDAQAEATCVGTTTSVWGSLSSRSAATSSRAGYMRE